MEPLKIAILVFILLIASVVIGTVVVATVRALGLPVWVEYLISGICGYILGRYLAKKWVKRL